MFDILSILPPPAPTIRIVDVGAMAYGRDAFEPLHAAGLARVVGFEPQVGECAKLNAMHAARAHVYLPQAVGDGTARTLYVTRHPPSSSLYEPDLALASKFQQLGELYEVVRTEPVQTRRLDEVEQARPCDVVKIDTQGAELDVIRGGVETIRDALIVHTEVEFVPLYRDQPLFADVDAALRGLGFTFFKFYSTAGRAFAPVLAGNDPTKRISQMLWADAVYVRDFMRFDILPPDRLIQLAIIAHAVYAAPDLAHYALEQHDRSTGAGLAATYLQRLTGG